LKNKRPITLYTRAIGRIVFSKSFGEVVNPRQLKIYINVKNNL